MNPTLSHFDHMVRCPCRSSDEPLIVRRFWRIESYNEVVNGWAVTCETCHRRSRATPDPESAVAEWNREALACLDKCIGA